MYPVSVSWQTPAKSMPCLGDRLRGCLRPSGPSSDRFGTLGLVRRIKPGDGAAAGNPDQHGSAALSREHLQRRANNSGENRTGPAYADMHDWMVGDVPALPADHSGFCLIPGTGKREGALRVNVAMKRRAAARDFCGRRQSAAPEPESVTNPTYAQGQERLVGLAVVEGTKVWSRRFPS
jgi:hypothetical protein